MFKLISNLFNKKEIVVDNTPKTVFTVKRRIDGLVVLYGEFGEKFTAVGLGNVELDGTEVKLEKERIKLHFEKGIPFAELI